MTDSGKCVRLCTSVYTLYFKSIILDYTIVYYLYDSSACRMRAFVSISMCESISCIRSSWIFTWAKVGYEGNVEGMGVSKI